MFCSSTEADLSGVGRHGRLDLVFGEKDGKTFLRDSYATMPMHCLPPLYPDSTGWAYSYLVNPTGGFVGGDRVEIDITLCEKSRLFLTTQSATRVYRSIGPYAEQRVNIHVREGAAIEYLPGYVIPFAGSLYRQSTTIRMEKNATALIADSFTTGRLAMGEHLRFGDYASSLEIEYDGLPLVIDKFSLRPADIDLAAFGFFESRRIVSTIYLIFDGAEKEDKLLEALRAAIDGCEGVLGGVSFLWSRGIAIRLLGAGARHVEKATARIRPLVRRAIFPEWGETGEYCPP